jgi:hypothetical protein
MIDPELSARLDSLEAKVTAAYKAAESARKYLFWTGVVTSAMIVLPLIGLVFAIPYFLSSYLGGFQPYLNTTPNGQPAAQTTQNASQTMQLLNGLGL